MHELIVGNKAALALPELFSDFNFSDLNTAIESLADVSATLTQGEKDSAIQVVEDWEQNVLSRLEEHEHDLNQFVDFLDPAQSGGYYHNDTQLDPEQMKALAGQTGTIAQLQEYIDAKAALDLHEKREPEEDEAISDIDVSYSERIIAQKEQEKIDAVYELQSKRLARKVARTLYAWKKAMQENPDIQKLISYVRSYRKNTKKFTRECQDKSQVARLNISIASPKMRETLKELLSFASRI